MYGKIFTGHLSKYSKCLQRRTVCEKSERQKCRCVLCMKVFCNEALRKNAASQCEEVFGGFCSKNGFVRIFRQNFRI